MKGALAVLGLVFLMVAPSLIDHLVDATPSWIVTTFSIAAILSLPFALWKFMSFIWREAKRAER